MLIKIAVSPLVKKMILKEFVKEPIYARLDTLFGKLVLNAIGQKTKEISDTQIEELSETLQVILPDEIKTYSLNRKKLALLNSVYYKIFKRELFLFIRAQTKAGLTIRESIENFFLEYKIKDEYDNETAHREWSRYQLKEKQGLAKNN